MSEDDDLTNLDGVGPATAEKLEDAGYVRFQDIATLSTGELTADTSIGDSTAQGIIQSAREEADVGGFQTGDEALEARKEIGKITTGVSDIDEILEGGFEEQAITQMYGEYAAGKSQFTHQMCVNVQLPPEHGGSGKRAIFIDTEESYRPERIEDMVRGLDDDVLQDCMDRDGVDGTPDDPDALDEIVEVFLSRVHSAQAQNVNHQVMLVEKGEDIAQRYRGTEFPLGLVVVDSIMGHFRAEYIGRGDLAQRQQKLTQHLDDLTAFASQYGATILLANQVQADPDQYFGDPQKPSGGNVLNHRSTFRAKLRQGKGDKLVFKLDDAPNLADGEAAFVVKDDGIKEA